MSHENTQEVLSNKILSQISKLNPIKGEEFEVDFSIAGGLFNRKREELRGRLLDMPDYFVDKNIPFGVKNVVTRDFGVTMTFRIMRNSPTLIIGIVAAAVIITAALSVAEVVQIRKVLDKQGIAGVKALTEAREAGGLSSVTGGVGKISVLVGLLAGAVFIFQSGILKGK